MMKTPRSLNLAGVLVAAAFPGVLIAQTFVDNALTYQGQLKQSGAPVTGSVDMIFALYDAPTMGNLVTSLGPLTVSVKDGLFAQRLDFGANVFTGEACWLQITVDGTPMIPRQELTPTPFALALPGLRTQQTPGTPNVVGGCPANMIMSGVHAAVIGGGGSLDDGGGTPVPNIVTDNAGTVSGGTGNQVGDGDGNPESAEFATIAGGQSNVASARVSTVSGGRLNQAVFQGSTVGGGGENTANGWWATIGGGRGNSAVANYATVGGGGRTDFANPATGNSVLDDHGTIGGGGNNVAGSDDGDSSTAPFATISGGNSNQALAAWCTVGGGDSNTASDTVSYVGGSTVCGGSTNTANGHMATVCGGLLNQATYSGAFIGGGAVNVASGQSSVVPGGENNIAGGRFSFAMGWGARAIHDGAFVWADSDTGSYFESTAADQFLVSARGGVGINTNNPASALHIGGTPGVDGLMFPDGTLQTTAWPGGGGSFTLPYAGTITTATAAFRVQNDGTGIAIDGESFGNIAVKGVANNSLGEINYGGYFEAYGSEARAVAGVTNGAQGTGVFALSYGTAGRGLYAEATGATGVGIRAVSANDKAIDALTSSSSTNEWTPTIYGRNEGAGDGVYGWSQNRYGAVGVTSSSNPAHAAIWAKNNGAGPGVLAEAGTDGNAGVFKGNVEIRSFTTGATVIELGEGLDYAEGFDVTGAGDIGPGAVVVIDPANAGKLMLSAEAYDCKVAGIVAGANGLGSAVRLGVGSFDHDVALAGRVYCNVDATYGAISPGDLLTTSPTAGHAMLATDRIAAQGAILGKAMEALPAGAKGQILVLVTLQ